MENTTTALLIAAGILITIIVVSLGVGLYVLFSNQSKEYSQIIENTEIQKFNSNFEIYVGRTDITSQEIVSIVNLAKEYGNQIEIIVTINGLKQNISNSEEFIKNNLETSFKCNASYNQGNKNPQYDELGRITKIHFSN